MTEGKRRIDRILSPDYVSGLKDRAVAEIRTMRTECADEEAEVSFERRLVHGRLAILRAELERRSGNTEISLTEMLPKILGDEARGPSRGAFPSQAPSLEYQHPKRRISRLISDDTLANLPALADEELRRIITELEDVEREVSDQRRPLLDVLNVLNGELARRYQTGEADPGDVLTPGR